jgi:hypothetical protein
MPIIHSNLSPSLIHFTSDHDLRIALQTTSSSSAFSSQMSPEGTFADRVAKQDTLEMALQWISSHGSWTLDTTGLVHLLLQLIETWSEQEPALTLLFRTHMLRHRAFSTRPIFPLIQYVILANVHGQPRRQAALPAAILQGTSIRPEMDMVLQSQSNDLFQILSGREQQQQRFPILSSGSHPSVLLPDITDELRQSVFHPYPFPSFDQKPETLHRMTQAALTLAVMLHVAGTKTSCHLLRTQSLIFLYQRKHVLQLQEMRWAYKQLEHLHARPDRTWNRRHTSFASHPLFAAHVPDSVYGGEKERLACMELCAETYTWLRQSHGAIPGSEYNQRFAIQLERSCQAHKLPQRSVLLAYCFRLCTFVETEMGLYPLHRLWTDWPPKPLAEVEQETLLAFTVQNLCEMILRRLQDRDRMEDKNLKWIDQYLSAVGHAFYLENDDSRSIHSCMRDWVSVEMDREIKQLATECCTERLSLFQNEQKRILVPASKGTGHGDRRVSYMNAIRQASEYSAAEQDLSIPNYAYNRWALTTCPYQGKLDAAQEEQKETVPAVVVAATAAAVAAIQPTQESEFRLQNSPSFGEFQSGSVPSPLSLLPITPSPKSVSEPQPIVIQRSASHPISLGSIRRSRQPPDLKRSSSPIRQMHRSPSGRNIPQSAIPSHQIQGDQPRHSIIIQEDRDEEGEDDSDNEHVISSLFGPLDPWHH